MRISEISVVIPTRDRPDDLHKCIASLAAQNEVFPKEIVVVDSGDRRTWLDLSEWKNAYFPVRRIASEPGLTRQRNKGVKATSGEIIAFLDDDCVVTKDYIQAMETAFRELPDAGGIQGIIVNIERLNLLWRLFAKMFFIIEIYGSGVLRNSGAASFVDQRVFRRRSAPVRTEVIRGISNYRRAVFERGFSYDEGLEGYCLGEDFDFAYRVNKAFHLYVDPRIRLYHFRTHVSRVDNREFYYQRTTNYFGYWWKYKSCNGTKNHVFFVLYMMGCLIQAVKICVTNRDPGAIQGWIRGFSQIRLLHGKWHGHH